MATRTPAWPDSNRRTRAGGELCNGGNVQQHDATALSPLVLVSLVSFASRG